MVQVSWPRWQQWPYMVKTLKNLLLQNCWLVCLGTWYATLGDWVYSNGDHRLTLTYFSWRSNLVLGLLNLEKVKHCIFQNNGTLWYERRCFMHLCECPWIIENCCFEPCERYRDHISQSIWTKVAQNIYRHKILDEFNNEGNQLSNTKVICPWFIENCCLRMYIHHLSSL